MKIFVQLVNKMWNQVIRRCALTIATRRQFATLGQTTTRTTTPMTATTTSPHKTKLTNFPSYTAARQMSDEHRDSGELMIEEILKKSLEGVDACEVRDISGGCGSMYEVYVSSESFRGKRTIQQHRIVTQVLKEQIKDMHGLRINTDVPKTAET